MKLEIFTHEERYGEPCGYPTGEFIVLDTDTGFPDCNFTLGHFKTRKEAEAFVKKHGH